MASFSDDFNRADGALGANWNTLGETPYLSIVSNRVGGGSDSDGTAAIYVNAMGGADYTLEEVVGLTTTAVRGFMFRCPDASAFTGYSIYLRPQGILISVSLDLWNAGVWQDRKGDFDTDLIVEEVEERSFKVEVVGDSFTVYIDGDEIVTFVDATLTTGSYVGMYGLFTVGTIDNFVAQDYGDPEPSALGGTLTPTTWVNKLALEALTM